MVVVVIVVDVVMAVVVYDHGFLSTGEAGEADRGKTKDEKGFHLYDIRVVWLYRR